jgi:tripartite-type tricarboxylate transporter receptor subunit TctC
MGGRKMRRRGRERSALLLFGTCLAAMAGPAPVAAQPTAATYPSKVVRVIVPFPPGSGIDLVTRIVIPRLAESVGQPFVIDNRGGAGGTIGTEAAARAAADGYTLYVGGTGLVVKPLTEKVSFSVRDFASISRFASVPFILVVSPNMPVRTVQDLIALARAKPGTLNYASTGNWTTPHLTSELFRQQAKVDIVHVPYKGSGPALTDLLGGHVDLFFCNMLSATPLVNSGKLTALAVTSLQRSPVAPQVPTMSESGLPNFETATWFGLMAPAGVDERVVSKLFGEAQKALRRPDVQKDLASQGASPTLDKAPADMANYIRSESEKWGRVLKTLGLKSS